MGQLVPFLGAMGDRALMYAIIGTIFLVIVFVVGVVPASADRKHLRVQHPLLTVGMLRELAWPLALTPMLAIPLLEWFGSVLAVWELHRYFGDSLLSRLIDDIPPAVQVLVGVLVVDFTTYVRHRFVHSFAWPYHTIHHAAREINWTTTSRLHPGDTIIMGVLRIGIMALLGFDGPAMGTALVIYNVWNWFNHVNFNLDFGFPLRYVLVSPNMHRWHHAAGEPLAVNKNFGVVFAFWDVVFGTFYLPKDAVPVRYGVLDEQGVPVVSDDLVDQFIYPFRVHKETLERWLRPVKEPAHSRPAGAGSHGDGPAGAGGEAMTAPEPRALPRDSVVVDQGLVPNDCHDDRAPGVPRDHVDLREPRVAQVV